MTKQVQQIVFITEYPGRVGVVGNVRFIDPEQGTHVNEYGMELLNYDKALSIEAGTLELAAEVLGNAITEVLCEDDAGIPQAPRQQSIITGRSPLSNTTD